MSTIEAVHYREIVRPLRTTFSTSLGRKDVMRSIIVKVRLKDGSVGVGECPTSLAIKHETIPVIKDVITKTVPLLKNLPIEAYAGKAADLRTRYPQHPMTVSGLEVALFRAFLAQKGTTEHSYFGGKLGSLETDITIPYSTDSTAIRTWMEYAVKTGFTVYKLKVGGNPREDSRLLSQVAGYLKDRLDTFVLRLDGNQGFTAKSYLSFVDTVVNSGYPLELFEQPLPKDDYKGLEEVKSRSPVPVILDETVFGTDDLKRVIEDDLGHGINIKVAKSGISESVKLYDMARKHGLSLMIGCMTETMAGLSAGINLAAGLGGFDYIDLDGVHFLQHKKRYGSIQCLGPRYLMDKIP